MPEAVGDSSKLPALMIRACTAERVSATVKPFRSLRCSSRTGGFGYVATSKGLIGTQVFLVISVHTPCLAIHELGGSSQSS